MSVIFNHPLFQQELFGNTLAAYGTALLWFTGLLVVLWLLQKLVLVRLRQLTKRTATQLDDTIIKVISEIRPPFYFAVAVFFAIRAVTLPALAGKIINGILIVIIIYQVIISLQVVIDYAVRRRLRTSAIEKDATASQADPNLESAISIINKIAKISLWIVGALFLLSNLGINITSLIASLGIGGIAVALAAQNILSDLFSSLAIYLDKPFKIGETIKVNDVIGKVKYIGIKTTRIEALSGEEVIFSNRELTSAQIYNYQRMTQRRVSFDLAITYHTSTEQLAEIPKLIEQAFKGVDNTQFNRAHFRSFGDTALIFEVVYHVTVSSYRAYMTAQQAVNLKLKQVFDEHGILFAYPARTAPSDKTT